MPNNLVDPAVRAVIDRHRQFFAGGRHLLVKVALPSTEAAGTVRPPDFDTLDWSADFDDYVAANVRNCRQLAHWRLGLKIADDTINCYHPYFGISIHHSFFGGAVHFGGGTSFADPVLDRASLWPTLKADPDSPWLARLRRGLTYCRDQSDGAFFASFRGGNGPLDMANGVMGNAFFTELGDDPDNMRIVLDICSDAVRSVFQWQKQWCSHIDGGRIVPMGNIWVPDECIGHISLDAACLIGPRGFAQFEQPWLEAILAENGGAVIHTHMLGRSGFHRMCQTGNILVFAPVDDPNQPTVVDDLDFVLAQTERVPLMFSLAANRIVDTLPKLEGRQAVLLLTATDADDAARQLDAVDSLCTLDR